MTTEALQEQYDRTVRVTLRMGTWLTGPEAARLPARRMGAAV